MIENTLAAELKLPYISPRITEKAKVIIDIQTNSVPGQFGQINRVDQSLT